MEWINIEEGSIQQNCKNWSKQFSSVPSILWNA